MPFEDWETDHKIGKGALAIILIIILAAVSLTAYGIYKITSPTVNTNANTPAMLSIVINGTAYFDPGTYTYPDVTVGDTLELKSQLSDFVQGEIVQFYVNDQLIGSDSTDDTGTAIYSYSVTQAGALSLYATCMHS